MSDLTTPVSDPETTAEEALADDPTAGIPAELLDQVGSVDRDSAGGCG